MSDTIHANVDRFKSVAETAREASHSSVADKFTGLLAHNGDVFAYQPENHPDCGTLSFLDSDGEPVHTAPADLVQAALDNLGAWGDA